MFQFVRVFPSAIFLREERSYFYLWVIAPIASTIECILSCIKRLPQLDQLFLDFLFSLYSICFDFIYCYNIISLYTISKYRVTNKSFQYFVMLYTIHPINIDGSFLINIKINKQTCLPFLNVSNCRPLILSQLVNLVE